MDNYFYLNTMDYSIRSFGVFTFGWFEHSEIDFNMLKIFEDIFKVKLAKDIDGNPVVVTKQDVMKLLRTKKIWHYNKDLKLDTEAELLFNIHFSKQESFIHFIKNSWWGKSILIDDQVERMDINFPNIGKLISTYNINDLT